MVGATHRHLPIPENVAVYAQLMPIYHEHRRQADRRICAHRRVPARRSQGTRRPEAAAAPTAGGEPINGGHRWPFIRPSRPSPIAFGNAARQPARRISPGWNRRAAADRCADISRAPTSRTHSPPSRRPRSASSARQNCRTSASSPPTTTCSRRISRWSAFPAIIKQAAREAGGVAQFAGGVPAMCDGVTQGEPGMELSLFSRDVIALATAVSLSHNTFDAALCLGICDKIVPGPADRRAGIRPSADDPGAGRADAVGPAEPGQGEGPPALRAGQGRPRRAARSRVRRRITPPAPAPSTAPPTATRC